MSQDVALEPELSFIIPAKDEAKNILRTLKSISLQAAAFPHQVIVVDNNSVDATASLAEEAGATVLKQPTGSIAAVRNAGARLALGKVLVFLDADVALTDAWRKHMPACLDALSRTTAMITGSHCSPPESCSWIERHWFSEFAVEEDASHLGTGHMILTRDFFQFIGGFDEDLETGEDYEICQRARALGGKIFNNPDLHVVHHDFPRTLQEFVAREAWHGRGDLRSTSEFMRSKVAIGAVVFLVAHFLMFAGVFLTPLRGLLPAGLLLLLLLLLASTWKKFSHAPFRSQIINFGLFYPYYLGRSISFLPSNRKQSMKAAADVS